MSDDMNQQNPNDSVFYRPEPNTLHEKEGILSKILSKLHKPKALPPAGNVITTHRSIFSLMRLFSLRATLVHFGDKIGNTMRTILGTKPNTPGIFLPPTTVSNVSNELEPINDFTPSKVIIPKPLKTTEVDITGITTTPISTLKPVEMTVSPPPKDNTKPINDGKNPHEKHER